MRKETGRTKETQCQHAMPKEKCQDYFNNNKKLMKLHHQYIELSLSVVVSTETQQTLMCTLLCGCFLPQLFILLQDMLWCNTFDTYKLTLGGDVVLFS